ncbi:hypothetical protein [Salinarimonas sp.]|uniref:hypothetical protein n=1 Tax=Salinarimonas sp. TaxID=2766526 RepID=UPI0032D94340
MSSLRPASIERFVQPTDDNGERVLVGLLAFAVYEQDTRELIGAEGVAPEQVDGHHLLLTSGQIELYKASAHVHVERLARTVLDQLRPEIEEETRTQAIDAAKSEIVATVRASTSWRTVVLFNVVAWLLTLAITFLVAVGFGNLTLTINPA